MKTKVYIITYKLWVMEKVEKCIRLSTAMRLVTVLYKDPLVEWVKVEVEE